MLTLAVPGLYTFNQNPYGGISRVIRSVCEQWPDTHVLNTDIERSPLPFFRNFIGKVMLPQDSNMVLLPQMTGSFALQTCRVPSCVLVHDIGIVDWPEDLVDLDWLTRFSIERSFSALQYATRIITPSAFTARQLALHYPKVASKITTIPLGIGDTFRDVRLSQSEARNHLERVAGRLLGSPLLLYVGTERPRKHVPFLFDVLKILKEKYPTAQLIKVGAAGGTQHRRRTAQHLMQLHLTQDDVVFLPTISDEDLAIAYRAADVYVSASQYEGFCLPVLEAITVGAPVVAVEAGSLPEVVGPLGSLVPPDPQTFAQAVIDQLSAPPQDPDKRARWLENFTWTRVAEQYMQVIQQLVTQTKSPGAVHRTPVHGPFQVISALK